MSYQSTTPNFDLPQWVYSDPPQMNDFNTAFANIDEKAIPNDEKGAANGVATLNSSGKLTQMPTAADVGAVPTSRTVNGKALSSNITLAASDVGALPIAGGTMTGVLNLKANQYGGTGPSDELYALNCQNSNIIGVNRILTADSAGGPSEGWGFKREDDGDKYDVIWAADGKLYFTPGFKYNTPPYPSNYTVLHSGGGAVNGKLQFTGTSYPQIYGNGTLLQLSWANNSGVGVVLGSGAFRDAGDGNINLGASNHRFATVFAKTGSINTSDRNEKNTIADIDPEQAEKLIMGLKPSTFKFNDGTSGRTHWGIISQDIEELLPQIGMTDMDFAGFIKSPKTEDYYEDVSETVTDEETGEEKTVTRKELKTRVIEGEYVYALRYSEFIAPLICMVQKQQKQIENLERRLSALENKEEAK